MFIGRGGANIRYLEQNFNVKPRSIQYFSVIFLLCRALTKVFYLLCLVNVQLKHVSVVMLTWRPG